MAEQKDVPSTEHVEPPAKGSVSSDIVTEKTIHAHNATLAAALTEGPVNPWSKGYRKMYAICLLVYLCSTMTGMRGSNVCRSRQHTLTTLQDMMEV